MILLPPNLNHEDIILLASGQRKTSHLQGQRSSCPQTFPQRRSERDHWRTERWWWKRSEGMAKGLSKTEGDQTIVEVERQKVDVPKGNRGTQHPWSPPEKPLSWNSAIDGMGGDYLTKELESHSKTRWWCDGYRIPGKTWDPWQYLQSDYLLYRSATEEYCIFKRLGTQRW